MIEIVNIIQILIGAVIMLSSIFLGLKIRRNVPEELQRKWFVAIILMGFFFSGYLLSVLVLLFKIDFSLEMITASVFLGGGCFVYIIIKLSGVTIISLMKKDIELQRTLLEIAELRDTEEERMSELNLVNHQLMAEIENLKSSS